MAKVAEVLVQTLIEAGVKRVYGVAGDSLNGMTDTIRKSDKIEWLHGRGRGTSYERDSCLCRLLWSWKPPPC